MRISDWSSDLCSSDLHLPRVVRRVADGPVRADSPCRNRPGFDRLLLPVRVPGRALWNGRSLRAAAPRAGRGRWVRSEARRVGKECVRTVRFRWSPAELKKTYIYDLYIPNYKST